MSNYVKLKKLINTGLLMSSIFILIFSLSSCDPSLDAYKFDLPDANSKLDETPPEANFSAAQSEVDFLLYTFANLSTSSTTYNWDFGDGNTSTEKDGTNTYPAEGSYTVTLTASDALGVENMFSLIVDVVEPPTPSAIIPDILEASFEDNSLPDGTGDGRISWRNSALGGVIQITSSPTQDGSQASKFPSAGDRIAYQELTVSPNADYILTYYYTLKTNNPGSLTVSILDATTPISNISEAAGVTIESFQGTNQSSANTYIRVDLSFNSGATTAIAILITNEGEEARVDDISIAL
ncbi:MAG: PKD domain-containing protein [Flavobacteriaceae bacterium]|nr:PKD domain-containing protein [Flavobacteriaceae bacterium]